MWLKTLKENLIINSDYLKYVEINKQMTADGVYRVIAITYDDKVNALYEGTYAECQASLTSIYNKLNRYE